MTIYWRLHSRLVYSFNDECPSAINVHWEAHGRYNEPLVSKSNAFLNFVQLAGQLHNAEQASVGYLRKAPAHKVDKLNTVVMGV